MFRSIAIGAVIGMSAAAALAQVPATRPAATQPTGTQPAATLPGVPVDPRVHAVLQRLETKGEQVKDLSASLVWEILDEVIMDEQSKIGTLWFKRDKPHDKFLVRFDRTIVEDQEVNKPEEHLFDGEWYTEKRESTKTVIRRQIVRPGEQYDPFKLGQGPFPLPFGQKESEILDRFDVTCMEPAKEDPAGSVHLKLVPKASSGEIHEKYEELHFYIDRRLDMPVKVIARQKDGKIVTVQFREIKTNTGIPGSRFVIDLPKNDPSWDERVETLPPAEPATAR